MRLRDLLLAVFLVLLAGCAGEDPRSRPLRIWTAFEGNELDTLRTLCKGYPQPVEVLQVPFDGLKNKVLVATPAGQGPEVVIGPQDWLGVFSAAGLLQPLPQAKRQALQKSVSGVALEGVTFDDQAYAYPILLEGLALLRNPRLAPRAPRDLEDLHDYALELQAQGIKGFYFDLRELYFSWPIFSAYGSTVFRTGSLEPGLTGPEGLQACQYLRRLRQDGLIPLGAKNDFAKSMFLEGKLAMTLNGPWFLSDVRKKGMEYVIEPIPPGKQPAASFIGVTGLMVNRLSPRRDESWALLDYLGSDEAQVRMALASGRVPAGREAQKQAALDPEKGKDIQAFTRVVEQGQAMPNHPAANAVWDPMRQSLELISKGEVDPAHELQDADHIIREKIQRMVE